MEIVVITAEATIPSEASLLNKLLGLEGIRLHIRKPGFTISEAEDLLSSIESRHYGKIIIQGHHSLYEKYSLKGIHVSLKDLHSIDRKDFRFISTSVHSIAEFNSLDGIESAYLSPVFDSFSKPGYKGSISSEILASRENYRTSLIGLGGVSVENLGDLNSMGFDGAGFLGSIWLRDRGVDEFINAMKCLQEPVV